MWLFANKLIKKEICTKIVTHGRFLYTAEKMIQNRYRKDIDKRGSSLSIDTIELVYIVICICLLPILGKRLKTSEFI